MLVALLSSQKKDMAEPQSGMVLLHGTLEINVYEAVNLPNLDKLHAAVGKCVAWCHKPWRPSGNRISVSSAVTSETLC